MSTPPDKPGFYLAKSETYKWYNLIVQVYGRNPYLRLRAWDRLRDTIVELKTDDIKEWGRLIMEEEE